MAGEARYSLLGSVLYGREVVSGRQCIRRRQPGKHLCAPRCRQGRHSLPKLDQPAGRGTGSLGVVGGRAVGAGEVRLVESGTAATRWLIDRVATSSVSVPEVT